MSLDVYLKGAKSNSIGSGIWVRENGSTREISRDEWDAKFPGHEPVVFNSDSKEVYHANITHNLGNMADAAGIYEALWRPEEIFATKAAHLIAPLAEGLTNLLIEPDKYKFHDPSNGWGNYEGLVKFVSDYLKACIDNPDADIEVSR